ncbi:MAG: hypothetical protein KME26_26275 [Oscillatoria princeps RMCB-10]|nr:hypothetical protein [Oscillatoria princeps RMCB-10]
MIETAYWKGPFFASRFASRCPGVWTVVSRVHLATGTGTQKTLSYKPPAFYVG